MVKASTVTAAFSLILLVFMASLVSADDRGAPEPKLRATVSLSHINTSEPEAAQAAHTNAIDTADRSDVAADARDDAAPTLAEKPDDGAAPTPSDPADAETVAGLSGGDSTVTAKGNNDAAASAAPVLLGSADDTCMGSSGGGGQGAGFGFGLGSTWTDENCKMLKNARELKSHGHHAAAKARLCMDNDNALAFELAGEPCPRALPSAQAAIKTIRDRNPGYRAAAPRGFQVAARTDGTGRNGRPAAENQESRTVDGLASTGGETVAMPKIDTVIAMVVSAVSEFASGIAANFDIGPDGGSAMDGVE